MDVTYTPNTVLAQPNARPPPKLRPYYDPSCTFFLNIFFLLLFLLLVLSPVMVVFLGALQSRFIFTHYTHTLGRRTIIYRTTSVWRVRHPCATRRRSNTLPNRKISSRHIPRTDYYRRTFFLLFFLILIRRV